MIENEHPEALITFEYHYGDLMENETSIGRTEWYHVFSHPYVFFDGVDPVIGAANCLSASADYRAHYDSRMAQSGGLSPIAIDGQFAEVGNDWIVVTQIANVDGVPIENLQASILVYEDDIVYCCGPGGNSVWDGVVRIAYDQPIDLPLSGQPVTVPASIPLDPTWNRENLHLVAYVQDRTTREILQGHRVTAPLAAVPDERTTPFTLSITPNPSRGPVRILFDLTQRGNSSPVQLEVIDVTGRRIADLSGMVRPAERNLFSWSPPSETTGVLFLRAIADGKTVTSRLMRVR